MARNLLIILPVIVFVAITWSICFLMDNKLVLFFFEKGHYVFSTGTGLRGLVIIKASVGKDTSCKITLTNTYTKLLNIIGLSMINAKEFLSPTFLLNI